MIEDSKGNNTNPDSDIHHEVADSGLSTSVSAFLKLTDSELLNLQFRIDDPEILDDLSMEIPTPDEQTTIEFYYDLLKVDRPLIACVHCGYPNHKKGVVIRDGHGNRYLVGHECGAKIYGADYVLIERRFDELVNRQTVLKLHLQIKDQLPIAIHEITQIADSGVLNRVTRYRSEFKAAFPKLFNGLRRSSNEHGQLVMTRRRRVLDQKAEERRIERNLKAEKEIAAMSTTQFKRARKDGSLPKIDKKQRFTEIEEVFAPVRGGSLIQSQSNPLVEIEAARGELSRLSREIEKRKTDTIGTREFQKIRGAVRGQARKVIKQLDCIKAVREFTDPAHLGQLADWANDRFEPRGSYSSKGRAFEWISEDPVEPEHRSVKPHGSFQDLAVPALTGLMKITKKDVERR